MVTVGIFMTEAWSPDILVIVVLEPKPHRRVVCNSLNFFFKKEDIYEIIENFENFLTIAFTKKKFIKLIMRFFVFKI